MLKILTLLSIITLSSFSNEFVDDFDTEVQNGYEEYQVYDEYSNSYYTIKVVYGLVNNEVRYGLCFYSDIPKDYNVNILHDNKLYKLDENSRGDVSAVALKLESGDVFSVVVYNKSGNLQHNNKFQNIEIMSLDQFNNLENKVVGQGNGITLTKLSQKLDLDFKSILYIIFGFIIVFCGLIILIFYKRHKGMFSADVKSKNVFNFKEFLNSTFEDVNNEEYTPESNLDYTDKDEPKESYNKNYVPHYSWARDEEERSGFDIKDHLRDMGFVSDYTLASEEEKNQIMLELMRLRDEKTITKDDYLEETSKLWKK